MTSSSAVSCCVHSQKASREVTQTGPELSPSAMNRYDNRDGISSGERHMSMFEPDEGVGGTYVNKMRVLQA